MTESIGFHIKLHPERDADLLAAIESAADKSARFRELARLGLSVERSTAQTPKTVERSTILPPESVLRSTETVERSTVAKPEPPPPVPAENPPTGSGNGKPPQFVPPPGFLQMTKPAQNKIRADFQDIVAKWKREHGQ